MSEFDNQINVTPGTGASYNVWSGYSKDTLAFTAAGLLALADWIEYHRGELTRQVNAPSEPESIGEDGEPYVNLYATQNPRDPAYWSSVYDTGPAHYNPRIGLEPERDTGKQEALEPLTPGDDRESIEEHLQELSEQERRQAEGE